MITRVLEIVAREQHLIEICTVLFRDVSIASLCKHLLILSHTLCPSHPRVSKETFCWGITLIPALQTRVKVRGLHCGLLLEAFTYVRVLCV